MTYSIVARDPNAGALGVAAQSHFFGVGRLVGWGEAGVGAVATQAFVNVNYGPGALQMLRAGRGAQDIVETLTGTDELRGYRQLAVVDTAGTAVSYTGDTCAPVAGGAVADGVAVQGNMLASAEVWPAMFDAYKSAAGDLADRLLAALRAAEGAGGDVRGSQSAVLTVFSGTQSATPWAEVLVDLRVDDHPDPVGELGRLLPRHRAFDLIGSVVFAPNLTIGRFEGVSPELLWEKLDGLAAASVLLGADNREADFWRALLLARSGNRDAAKALFHDVFVSRPQLSRFLAGIAPLGFLDCVDDYLPEACGQGVA